MNTHISLLAGAVLIFLSSCATTKYVTPEFTTTSKIYDLYVGMTEQELINVLAIQPYEISYNVNQGEKVLTWYYRKPHHEVKSSKQDSELVLDPQVMKFKEEGVLHVYIKEGKLTNFFTDSGQKQSENLIKVSQKLAN